MEDATTSRFERVEFAIRRRRLSESIKVDSSRDDSLVLTHCFYKEYSLWMEQTNLLQEEMEERTTTLHLFLQTMTSLSRKGEENLHLLIPLDHSLQRTVEKPSNSKTGPYCATFDSETTTTLTLFATRLH